jgi:CRISPR-associated endonuclease Csn1
MINKKVLGLDFGTNSLGWALLSIDENKNESSIIDGGVRIFPKGVEDKTPTPKNQKRRNKRLGRRVLQRRARRKLKMLNTLISHGLLPLAAKTDKLEKILTDLGDPYILRAKALDAPLQAFELGRVLYHLVQRRGFLSNKKVAVGQDMLNDPDVLDAMADLGLDETDDAEETDFYADIYQLQANMKELGSRTLGEYLATDISLPTKRNRKGTHLRTERSMYVNEFHAIIDVQRKHHSCLTEEVIERLYSTIFHQRPLKFKKSSIGQCSLEPKKRRIEAGRMEYQRFRYLCDVNNLSYFDNELETNVFLSGEQRATLISLFETQADISFAELRKALGLSRTTKFNLENGGVKKLKGNRTAAEIIAVYPEFENLSHEKQTAFVEDLVSFEKKVPLKERLKNYWGLAPETAVKVAILELENGHGNLSLKAINKLLPHLEEGLELSQARIKVGYGYEVEESNLDLLPAMPELPNPIVMKSLGAVRKVVNEIIKKYGKPDSIRIEMARDLEMNTKRYASFTKQQKDNTKANDEAAAIFKKVTGLNHCSRDNKIKYRLWKEQGGICIYSGSVITEKALFSAQTEVDHILPYSQSLDDSYGNKVLCLARENQEKGQKTPIDAFGGQEEKWSGIAKRIAKYDLKLRGKKSRFYMKAKDMLQRDFLGSQLTDTRYISREAGQWMKKLGCDVTFTKGAITSHLRHSWNLNTIINEVDTKNRRDHRHHMIDAVAIACVDRQLYKAMIAQLKDLERTKSELSLSDIYFEQPIDNLREKLVELVDNTIVSYTNTSKPTGAIHEETGVGYVTDIGTVTRKRLDESFEAKNVSKIYDEGVRKLVTEHLAKYDNNPKIAFSSDNPVLHKDGKTPIKRVRIKQADTTPKKLESTKFGIQNSEGDTFKYHAFGNNYGIAGYTNEKGKFVAKVITMAERYNGFKLDDKPDIFLKINDMVKVEINGKQEVYRIQKMDLRGGITLKLHNISGADKNESSINEKSLKTLINDYKLEKIRIDALGKIA